MESYNDTCYTIPLKNGSSWTYCNITEQWKPTVNKTQAYTAAIIITLIAFIILIGKLSSFVLKKLHSNHKSAEYCLTVYHTPFACIGYEDILQIIFFVATRMLKLNMLPGG